MCLLEEKLLPALVSVCGRGLLTCGRLGGVLLGAQVCGQVWWHRGRCADRCQDSQMEPWAGMTVQRHGQAELGGL